MAPPAERRRASRTRRAVEFIAAGCLLVLLSVLATLIATGTVKVPGMGSAEQGSGKRYKTVTLTDAQLECRAHARKELGARIKNLAVDNHSSRYDERADRFKIFMEAELYDEGASAGASKFYYINCFCRTNRITITTFELLEDRQLPARVIRESQGGNSFGL